MDWTHNLKTVEKRMYKPEMTTDELINYWHGHLCMGIGAGKSRETVSLMVLSLQQLGWERGFEAGKAAQRNRAAKDKLRAPQERGIKC